MITIIIDEYAITEVRHKDNLKRLLKDEVTKKNKCNDLKKNDLDSL